MGSMRKSRLSPYKQDRLTEHFVAERQREQGQPLRCEPQDSAFYFLRLREIIAYELEAEIKAMFGGEIEVDESYFGGRRKGKRGRGAAGKIPAFGLLKRGGKVYTKIIPDASATLIPIIKRKVVPDSIVYSDCWRGYNVLDVSDFTTSASTILSYSPTATTISMASRISGTKPSGICANSMVFLRLNLVYI